MAKQQKEVRDLQEGNYIMLDGEPCEIRSYSTSKPGKHGSAKARIEGVGVFDGKRRSMTQPVDAKVYVPIVERKQGQVVSVTKNGNEAQVMDLDDYETDTMQLPDDASVQADETVDYLEWEGQRKFVNLGDDD